MLTSLPRRASGGGRAGGAPGRGRGRAPAGPRTRWTGSRTSRASCSVGMISAHGTCRSCRSSSISTNLAWMKCVCGSTSTRSAMGTSSGRRCGGISSPSPSISSEIVEDRLGVEDAGVDEQLEVLGAGPLDEVDVPLGHRVLDRRRRVDLRADDHVEVGGQVERALDGLLPDRVRVEVPGRDAELRPDRGEAEPLGQTEVELQLLGALLRGQVAVPPPRGVDPGSEVRRREAVLLPAARARSRPTRGRATGSPGCCPRRGSRCRWRPGRRSRRRRPRASSRCRCRRCSCTSRRRTCMPPSGAGGTITPLAADREVRPGDQRRDVRPAQVDVDLEAVHPGREPAGLGHGDGGRLVELPAHVGRGAQLVEGEASGPAASTAARGRGSARRRSPPRRRRAGCRRPPR